MLNFIFRRHKTEPLRNQYGYYTYGIPLHKSPDRAELVNVNTRYCLKFISKDILEPEELKKAAHSELRKATEISRITLANLAREAQLNQQLSTVK